MMLTLSCLTKYIYYYLILLNASGLEK